MMIYLFTSAVWLSVFYLGYRFLLEKETFFQLNRWVLLGSLVLAFSLPLLHVPEAWSLRQISSKITDFAWRSEAGTVPTEAPFTTAPQVIADKPTPLLMVSDSRTDATIVARPEHVGTDAHVITEGPRSASQTKPFSWRAVLWYIYCSGVGMMLFYFLYQFMLLIYHFTFGESQKWGPYRIVTLKKATPPFSFWNRIFLYPQAYDAQTLQQILKHEAIHLRQRHSIDMILAEGLLIVQWFNPFAWWYRNAMEKNLEFLTDKMMLTAGEDRTSYQYSLIRVALPQGAPALSNSYSQSTLKQRIMMMNTKRSKHISLWKYLSMLGAVLLAVLLFNPVKASVKAWQHPIETSLAQNAAHAPATAKMERVHTETVPDAESPVTNTQTQTQQSDAIAVSFKGIEGVWKAEIIADQVCFTLRSDRDNSRHFWMSERCFASSEFSRLPQGQDAEFRLEREAGALIFNGSFAGNSGEGRYTFAENAAFVSYLAQQGYKNAEEDLLFFCFLSNVNRAYFAYLDKMDLRPVDNEELKRMAIHELTLPYLQATLPAFAEMGFKDLSVSQLVKLRIHDVSPDYIRGLNKMGFDDVSLEKATQASIHDVSLDYVEGLAAAGYKNLSLEQVIKASIHDVSLEYVQRLGEMGYNQLSLEQVMKASIHDVDADYVQELRELGFKDLSLEDMIKASIHDVDTDYVRELQEIGYTDLSLDQIIRASIHDVDVRFVKQLAEAGYDNLSLEAVMKASIHDVDASLIKGLAELGYTNLSLEDVTKASIHDVSERYVGMLNDMGYKNIALEEVIKAKIHDIDERFISGLQELGYKNIPMRQLIELRIHDVTAQYIRNTGKKDLTLEEYKRMKIRGRTDRAE